jgi:hypothetical protein
VKYLVIVFSFYMTLLAIMPCRDTDDFGDFRTENTSFNNDHSGNEKTGKETCTPFCACACCSTVRTIIPQQAAVSIYIQEIKQIFAQPSVPALLKQSLSVWQPPQIA